MAIGSFQARRACFGGAPALGKGVREGGYSEGNVRPTCNEILAGAARRGGSPATREKESKALSSGTQQNYRFVAP